MDQLGLSWNREGLALENEIAEESPLSLNLSITDYRPEQEGASELTQWMADFGLLGDRPGNELLKNSVSEQLFTLLLNTGSPISLDAAHEQVAWDVRPALYHPAPPIVVHPLRRHRGRHLL